MELKSVVPWGRSLEEYRNIFMLSELDLNKSILGCGDGPASFNAEATVLGKSITSVDPVYIFTTQELQNRISEVYEEIAAQLEKNKENYIWETFKSVEDVFKTRMSAMNIFLKDYENGKSSGRYIEAGLPSLPFGNQQFSLALCSHFLFLYSSHLTEDFHIQGIKELCRVAKEVRIYPLVTLTGELSPHLRAVTESLNSYGYSAEPKPVPYRFLKNANEMLVVKI
jgi:hypothetical protein